MRILLVEDSPADVVLTKEVFARTGADVAIDVARDGVEALELLEALGTRLPDLILLDLNMPRMGGLELLERLKQTAGWRRIPVIVLSTSAAVADVEAAYDRHGNSFITKPVDLAEFLDVVHRIEAYWLSVVQLPSRAGG